MRLFILAAGAALTLAACGNNDQTDNTQNVDENLSAENIVSNDVTAIDAVTGDAANMAADVDVNFTNQEIDEANGSPSNQASPAAKPGKPAASKKPAASRAADQTPASSTANITE
jgi:hypothetical protein